MREASMYNVRVAGNAEIHDGKSELRREGFHYLPRALSEDEASRLISYFESLTPLWEQRYVAGDDKARDARGGRLTRPVYWLGAWQFACLGYYAEPDHREDRCVRAEPIPELLAQVLQRIHSDPKNQLPTTPANTCLINYYGRQLPREAGQVPVDMARLRMHRDGEPGPVVMLNFGQAGLLEFVDPVTPKEPELRVWTRHRSLTVLDGPKFKDRLYHRVSRVRTGTLPELRSPLSDFELRRISVSFRYVPEELILDATELSQESKDRVAPYLKELARSSEHFARMLDKRFSSS